MGPSGILVHYSCWLLEGRAGGALRLSSTRHYLKKGEGCYWENILLWKCKLDFILLLLYYYQKKNPSERQRG